ncbi:alpha-2-HS-glycoprotein isoform X2 [Latimeria chalumnae]|uniref:alpha-2-HS-glycoprotein isoform X2 n=1 Tax=Latimeria chalumnae TaxID=7897 RepID=UPI0003C14070
MKAFLALLVMTQLLSCKAVGVDIGADQLHPRLLDCDSPEAEAAANFAVNAINAHHHHGYKFALNRIESLKVKARRPFGEAFEMELDLLETKCHVVDPTPFEQCAVRPVEEQAVEGDCDVTLLKVDGNFSVVTQTCKSAPDSSEKLLTTLPTLPKLLPLNSSIVINAVNASLKTFNSNSTQDHSFTLLEVGRAFIQHKAAGDAVVSEFAIVETNCSDNTLFSDHCEVLGEDVAPEAKIHHHREDHAHKVGHKHAHGNAYHNLHHFTSSSESHSEEVPSVAPAPASSIIKRSAESAEVDSNPVADPKPGPTSIAVVVQSPPLCPGKIRHF